MSERLALAGRLRASLENMETRRRIDEYRGFRHVVRNVYAFNLQPARLNELIKDAPKCFSKLKEDVLAFADFLEKTAQ